MKKTLIVNYTPRVNSNTKKMVDFFIELNKEKTDITILDLAVQPPDLLLQENLNLYVNRNFGGIELNEKEQKVLAKNDIMMNQLRNADFVVFACPMYNFSLPATVKAWFDGVIQAGETFVPTESGFKGLCENTQAMVLMTSGSDFGAEPLKSLNFATPLISACFDLIGIPCQTINVFGLQQHAHKLKEMLENANEEIKLISEKWFG